MLLLCCLRQLSEISADLAEEHTTSHHASEILEAEQAERRRLEKECKDLTVSADFIIIPFYHQFDVQIIFKLVRCSNEHNMQISKIFK